MMNSGRVGSTRTSISEAAADARVPREVAIPSSKALGEHGAGFRSTFPASMREKSRTSSMRVVSCRAHDPRACTSSRCRSPGSAPSSAMEMPTMPLSGLRMSWETLAMNSLFAKFARSARSMARVSCSVRRATVPSSSAALRRNLCTRTRYAPYPPHEIASRNRIATGSLRHHGGWIWKEETTSGLIAPASDMVRICAV